MGRHGSHPVAGCHGLQTVEEVTRFLGRQDLDEHEEIYEELAYE